MPEVMSVRDRDESALRIVFEPARGQALVEAVPPGPSADAGELPGLDLTLAEWESDSFSFSDFDRYAETLAADAAGDNFEIRLSGETCRLASAARQIALRCQRLAGRRNAASSGELFDRVLACHRRFRDLPRAAAAAAYAHALDTWQWVLRLDFEASLALQLAALFHEAWRLTPEIPEMPETPKQAGGDRSGRAAGLAGSSRPEQELEESQAHRVARRGAWMTDELLAEAGIDLATRVRVHRLIAECARGSAAADPAIGADGANGADDALAADRALLHHADALSCFSLGAPAGAGCLPQPTVRADLAGHRPATAATMMARKRLAAGMAGGAGIAPTRVSALLARAALLGDLAAHPARQADAAAVRVLAAGGAKPTLTGAGAGASRARRRLLAIAAAKPARAKRSPAPAASCHDA
jgi:hypothetical protein